MSTTPTRKQPVKKKQTHHTPPPKAVKTSHHNNHRHHSRPPRHSNPRRRNHNRRGRGATSGLAVSLAMVVVICAIGYFATGKTINYYYVDDSQYEYISAGTEYQPELLDSVKYHIFNDTEFLKIDDYFEDDNLQNWKLTWYLDEDCKTQAEKTTIGFGDLFAKQSLYGLLSEVSQTENNIPQYEGTYYDDVVWTVDGLHTKLRYGFQATNYNFAGSGGALIQADTPEGSDFVYGIYDGQVFDQDWKSGKNFEREHVWCNSLLGMNRVTSSGKNQASDLHNLRAIGGVHSNGASINQTRSNRYFTNCTVENCNLDKDNDPTTHNGHTVGNKAFYPGSKHVGDVSRILMYMIVMYKDILKIPATEAEIIAADEHAYDKDYAFMPISDWRLLVTWNNQDPVDSFETNRNNVIYNFQGNRNPFIDDQTKLEQVLNLLVA